MPEFRSLEEANACSAIRLTEKRQRGKVGDIFRLSPAPGVFVWGRLIKRAAFFGLDAEFNLVYIYNAVSPKRPSPEVLVPGNLMFGPSVVNNLGFSRGYWEIIASEPLGTRDILTDHRFVQFKGTGSPDDYDLVDEAGTKLRAEHSESDKFLSQSGFGNYNLIDWRLQGVLRALGSLPATTAG
jgi:hypothetical protein